MVFSRGKAGTGVLQDLQRHGNTARPDAKIDIQTAATHVGRLYQLPVQTPKPAAVWIRVFWQ